MDSEFWNNVLYQTMLYNLNWDMFSTSNKWCMVGRDRATLQFSDKIYSITFDKPATARVAMAHFTTSHSQKDRIIYSILNTSASIEWFIRPIDFLDSLFAS